VQQLNAGARLAIGLVLAASVLVSTPARAQLLDYTLHLNAGLGSFRVGNNGTGYQTARNPLGVDLGVTVGVVPLIKLQFFVNLMSDFSEDGFLSVGARGLFSLSDHVDLGVAGNLGYSYNFNSSSGQFAWMLGPHLQAHVLFLNFFFQPSYASNVLGGGTNVIYPLYGGVGLQF
jgi:hypothetical protein